MTNTTTPLVLVTGATGFIGYRTLIATLAAGYRVRTAVRNEAGIAKIKAAASTKPYLSILTFILVPDILAPTAYNTAVRDVDYIIHLASPTTNLPTLPTESEYDARLIQPALRGTMNMLSAAKSFAPTVKRIVITASIVSIVAWPEMYMQTGTVFAETARTIFAKGPYGNLFEAYGASKVAALNATEEWVRIEKPGFEVNHIAPSFTIGRHELATTRAELLAGTNGAALKHVLGWESGPTPSTSVHVEDIAAMHVKALDPNVPGGQYFLGVSEGSNTRWEDAFEIVKKYFPGAVPEVFTLKGSNPTNRLIFDATYSKKTLGMEFKSFEEQVRDVAGQYLELTM